MTLQDLVLLDDEIKIFGETGFYIPIHPKLLDTSLSFDPKIANEVFERSAKEWQEKLLLHTKTLQDSDPVKKWYQEVFLRKKIKVKSRQRYQTLNLLHWEDTIDQMENGFVNAFSISRNSGGTIFFNPDSKDREEFNSYIFPGREGRHMGNIPKEKAMRFKISGYETSKDMIKVYTYAHHNVDNYPGALFLRTWGMNYMNEVFKRYKEIFNKE